ncbi:hypothetical protein Tco_0854953 [Tanacetum coccineum]
MEMVTKQAQLILPYGMLLTRLFKYVMSSNPELSNDRYVLYDHDMYTLAPHYERKTRKDYGTKRGRPFIFDSSSSAFDHPSSSHHVDDDDDENNKDSTGCVTPFVRWIEDYTLPDGLKMPSHVVSYDGKGDPDNYLHLFEGAISMKKLAMPVDCHM